MYTTFISALAKHLNATTETINTNISFNTYTDTSEGISAYLGLTYSNITNYDQYRLLAQPFKQQYQSKFNKAPYWNPVTRARWTRGATLPPSSYKSATQHYKTYQSWFRSKILPSCEEALMLYPTGTGTEDYRDTYTSPPTAIFAAGYPGTQMSVFAGVPDYTVPIGERTYFSRVSERTRHCRLRLGLWGRRGVMAC
jgi:hypothetical protein